MARNDEVRLLSLNEENRDKVEEVLNVLKKPELRVKTVWTSKEEALLSTFEEDVIYVVEPINDSITDVLVGKGFAVISSRCALTVLNDNVLMKPGLTYPLWSLAMINTIVCFSNIKPRERNNLSDLVKKMGGKVESELTENCSHLVVKEVGSFKYFSAADRNIPIMTTDWVKHIWKNSQKKHVPVADLKWESFCCPIFLGCCICVTGFNNEDRAKIKQLVDKFGGRYTGAMKLNETTHLVVQKPEGKKYQMAGKFGLKVVSRNWVYESIKKGSCQNHADYPVKAQSNFHIPSSTPKKPSAEEERVGNTTMGNLQPSQLIKTELNSADVSCITITTIDQTKNMDSTVSSNKSFNKSASKDTNADEILSFTFSSQSSLQLLDGVCACLLGFNNKQTDKLNQLLSLAGATRSARVSSSVTHVLVASRCQISDKDLDSIRERLDSGFSLSVVNHNWLLASLQNGQIQNEHQYWSTDVVAMPTDNHKSEFEANQPSCDDTKFMPEIKGLEKEEEEKTIDKQETQVSQITTFSYKLTILKNKTFKIYGFEDEDAEKYLELIEDLSGVLLPVYSDQKPDYALVPLAGCSRERDGGYDVTPFWIEICKKHKDIISPSLHPLSTPFDVDECSELFKGLVLCPSKFEEPERFHLQVLIESLGGVFQSNLAKKDVPSDDLLKTTHLIIDKPIGDKYRASVEWNIRIVTSEWVYQCARSKQLLSCSSFIPGDTQSYVLEPTCPSKDEDVDCMKPPASIPKKKKPIVEFQPITRGPSAADEIRKKYDAGKENISGDGNSLKDKILVDGLDSPSNFIGTLNTPDTSFDLKEVFEILKTSPEKQKRIKERLGSQRQSNLLQNKQSSNNTFDLQDVFEILKTPFDKQQKMIKIINRNPNTPLTVFVRRLFAQTIQDDLSSDQVICNLEEKFDEVDESAPPGDKQAPETSEANESSGIMMTSEVEALLEANDEVEEVKRPLVGAVVYISKKLIKERQRLSVLVRGLGAEYSIVYSTSCTHFVFQGKLNDSNRELRNAKKDQKKIVCPSWLEECEKASDWLDENCFPPSYDPNNSLDMVQRSTRKRRKQMNSQLNKSDNSEKSQKVTKQSQVESEESQQERESLKKALQDVDVIGKELEARRTRNTSKSLLSIKSVSPSTREAKNANHVTSEFSQEVQIEYDDPIGRNKRKSLIKEKMMSPDGSLIEEDHLPEVRDQNIENQGRISDLLNQGKVPIFLISSVSMTMKTKYSNLIERLGGKCGSPHESTHLILKQPTRNEKFLCSLASGKWILHTSYLDECEKADSFVQEDKFEFGNPASKLPQTKTKVEKELSAACYRWRRTLKGSKGAFDGWKVALYVSKRQSEGLSQVLKIGGADLCVVNTSIDLTKTYTHVIISEELDEVLSAEIIDELTEKGTYCCLAQYIAEYLMKDPIPYPKTFHFSTRKIKRKSNLNYSSKKSRRVT